MKTKLPNWDFSKSYVDIEHEKFINAFKEASNLQVKLGGLKDFSKDKLSLILKDYEICNDLCNSMSNFIHCLGALDAHDARVEPTHEKLINLKLALDLAAEPLFKALGELDTKDALWKDEVLAPWKYTIMHKKKSYLNKIPKANKELFASISKVSFFPLSATYNDINKLMDFEIEGRLGKEHIGIAKLTGLLKGSGTYNMRREAYEKCCEFYDMHAPLYADTLSAIHGFNLARIKAAGVDILQPALELNRISKEAIDAMFTTIEKHKKRIRDSVLLRAPYINTMANNKRLRKMEIQNLNAAAPSLEQYRAKKAGNTKLIVKDDFIPYGKAITLIKEALTGLDPSVAQFVDYMHKNGLVEARVSDKKVGGAFCEKFDGLNEQRIFGTYMGGFSSLTTQIHELGHAWHYHLLQDLPAVLSDAPMTIAESASIFNETLLRSYLLKKNKSEQFRFAMLWQELKAADNFLLHIPARFDFELSFLKERQRAIVGASQACDFMEGAWEKWYGNTTIGCETYLWCFKQHFYMTDQYLYNFPYTVGYLIAQGLAHLKEAQADGFFNSYKSFYKDSGKMSVDDLIKKHLGYDITQPDFWEDSIAKSLSSIDQFEKSFKI